MSKLNKKQTKLSTDLKRLF